MSHDIDKLHIRIKNLENEVQRKELLIESYVETIDKKDKRLITQEEIIANLKK